VFTELLSWRWVFWINLPCCFAAFAIIYFVFDTTSVRAPNVRGYSEMDWIGTAAIISMTILVLLSLDFGGVVFPWKSPKIIGILISGLAMLVAFVLWETKGAKDPLIPIRLLDSISKASPLVVCFTHGMVCRPSLVNKETDHYP
jgi:MFS family permease